MRPTKIMTQNLSPNEEKNTAMNANNFLLSLIFSCWCEYSMFHTCARIFFSHANGTFPSWKWLDRRRHSNFEVAYRKFGIKQLKMIRCVWTQEVRQQLCRAYRCKEIEKERARSKIATQFHSVWIKATRFSQRLLTHRKKAQNRSMPNEESNFQTNLAWKVGRFMWFPFLLQISLEWKYSLLVFFSREYSQMKSSEEIFLRIESFAICIR